MWGLVWCDAMSVAVEDLDNDHRRALTFMDRLRVRIMAQDRTGGARRLARLMAHNRRHFRREEQMLAECGFPGLAAHRDHHHESERLLARLQSALAEAPWPVIGALFDEVCANFVSLIAADIEYKWFLIDRGVVPRFSGAKIHAWERRRPQSIAERAPILS